MEVRQADLLGAGSNQIAMEAGKLRVLIAPQVGGRLVELSYDGTNVLHALYPRSVAFGPYAEYGGLEEHVGGAPGTLWNAPWRWEALDDRVTLSAYSGRTLVRKSLRIREDLPLLQVEYEFSNYSVNFCRFTFGIHPEIAVRGDHRTVRFHAPVDGRVESGGYTGPGFRKYVTPEQGWCAATAEDLLFAQMLPNGVADSIEIYYPRVDTHLVLEPIIFGVGLSPQKMARFTYAAYLGPGSERDAAEIYAQLQPELHAEYVAAPPAPEPPPDAERPEPRRPAQVHVDFDLGGGVHAVAGQAVLHAQQEAMRVVQEEMENVQREIEQAVREAEHEWAATQRIWQGPIPEPPEPPAPPQPPAPPAPPRNLRQERMRVLEGLAQGVYTVEEAAELLAKLADGA
jgi:hypothetical protein